MAWALYGIVCHYMGFLWICLALRGKGGEKIFRLNLQFEFRILRDISPDRIPKQINPPFPEQVRSDNDASELDILGPFGTIQKTF